MGLPVHDWQFWVVTAAGATAVLWLARAVMPGVARRKRSSSRATLTVGGKPVAPPSRSGHE